MKSSEQDPSNLKTEYTHKRETVLVRLAENLMAHIAELMDGQKRIDRITARAKGTDSFLKKAMDKNDDGTDRYAEPLEQIQDQLGARIVVFYKSDVEPTSQFIKQYFRAIESKAIVPDSDSKFGYFGDHHILALPDEIIEEDMEKALIPEFFELQIKTLFQHAWSEANHDLGYKPGESTLTPEQERKVAFTSAQGWGADLIFDELFQELNQAQ